ncbi:sigma1 [Mammalian orthoreovirus 2]|uniref:Sigma1 n=1 Tax=Mammalian orthoreovirus 2 TaxID=538121 RepID=A0A5K7VK58_9REOV|nr:sigma1 [Mammalian orthoreovirus 2]BBK26283.1 sigma1 [Mammalian orthoreovirus 2]
MTELQQLIRREILLLVTSGNNGVSKEIEEVKKQIKQISNDVSRISNELSTQRGLIDSLIARVATIESGMGDLGNRVTVNERSIASITEELGTVSGGISALGQRVDATEQGIARLDTVTGDLTGRTSILETNVSTLTNDLASLNTRVTTEVGALTSRIDGLNTRLTSLESSAVTGVGQGLEKTGNTIRVIAGNGMWFNGQNQLQLDLSGQRKGVGFDGSGMIVKIDTAYFSYDADGNITLNSNISELQSRTASLEAIKIDVVDPPLVVNDSGGSRLLRLSYDISDFRVVNQAFALTNRMSMPTFRFPLELDTSSNIVTLSQNYRIRTGQWSGQLEYQAPNLTWRVPVTVNLMRVNDWLILSFSRFTTNAILASGKFVLNFATGLPPGWLTGATAPSTTTNPLSTTFAAVQFINGSRRIDAFRILGVSEWDAGELEISNYGGTYSAHTSIDWAPMTLMYPCLG